MPDDARRLIDFDLLSGQGGRDRNRIAIFRRVHADFGLEGMNEMRCVAKTGTERDLGGGPVRLAKHLFGSIKPNT